MLTGYREVLGRRGAAAFCSAGFTGRIPVAMTGVAVVICVHATIGSYAVAGIMNAVATFAFAAAGPVTGRLVDRLGQARVLVPLVVAHAAAIVAEAQLVLAHAPAALLYAVSVPAGAFTPPIGALARARWSALLGDGPELGRAYALESVLDDLVFTIGPVIAAALSVWHPAAGLLAAAAIELAAGLAFAAQRSTAPPPHPGARRRLLSTLTTPGLRPLLVTVFGAGVFLGTQNVSIVAFAQRHAAAGAAGWLLGGFAAASGVSGIVYGQRRWQQPAAARLRTVLLFFCAGAAVLPLAATVPLMAVAVVLAGACLSPVLICIYTTASQAAPDGALTETLTWTLTALVSGSATGAALSGAIVNTHDARLGLLTGAFAVALAAVFYVPRRVPAAPRTAVNPR